MHREHSALLAACRSVAGDTRASFALRSLGVVLGLLALTHSAAAMTIYALVFVVSALCIARILEVAMLTPQITITEQDAHRLTQLLHILPAPLRAAVAKLEGELERAELVAPQKAPRDLVTMNSQVLYEDADTGKRSEVRLVYPGDVAKSGSLAISVLAPVGSALLGLRANQSIDWKLPTGRLKRYRVLEVTYQPEAAGDYHL